jgi:zinc transport system substrate-binding protein
MAKLVIAAFLILLSIPPAQAETPVVVASIQPLHSLAAAVMEGVGHPGLIVSGTASEHSYALKPSDARLIQSAQVVVLVDSGYETFLAKPLKGSRAEKVAMADLAGLTVLPLREGGVWDGHEHHDAHKGKGHDHDETDLHVWLDPANAKLLVADLAARLAGRDPDHAAAYQANAARTMARLDALDVDLKSRLAPLGRTPYVVFHDAYQYFEARYGLSPAGSITVDPDRPPSGKRLATLRERLLAAKASCVFREPQFPAPVVAALAQSAKAREGILDPQGADLPAGPDQYFTLMTRLADSLVSCLSGR